MCHCELTVVGDTATVNAPERCRSVRQPQQAQVGEFGISSDGGDVRSGASKGAPRVLGSSASTPYPFASSFGALCAGACLLHLQVPPPPLPRRPFIVSVHGALFGITPSSDCSMPRIAGNLNAVSTRSHKGECEESGQWSRERMAEEQ